MTRTRVVEPSIVLSFQLGFLNGICIPCYSLLHRLIPETNGLLKQCQENLTRWQAIEESGKEKTDK